MLHGKEASSDRVKVDKGVSKTSPAGHHK